MSSHSWQPIDLVALGESAPEPPTISGLVYPGKRHLIYGDTESAKTWLAQILCAEQILDGEHVVWVDFEMGTRDTLARLRSLGVPDDSIIERFRYFEPDAPLIRGTEAFADLEALLAEDRPALVVIDAMEGAMALHGLDPMNSGDVETYYNAIVKPFRAYGAAVVTIDHSVKDRERRGKFSSGSQRKLSASDVGLSVELVSSFGIGREAVARITCTKDRPGYLTRPVAAELHLTSDPESHAVGWAIKPAETATSTAGSRFRPTFLMQRVSDYLIGVPDPVSRNDVLRTVQGKSAALRTAIDVLIAEGYVSASPGARGSQMLASVRAFREGDIPTVSQRVPDGGTQSVATVSSVSPPSKGDTVDGVTVVSQPGATVSRLFEAAS